MKTITAYEHDKITFTKEEIESGILNALLKFNELHDNKYFDGIVNGIKLKQYVGIIQVNELSIEILPKIDRNKDDNTWRQVLIQMLKATGKLKVTSTGSANVRKQNMNLLEIYFEVYLKEVQHLIRSGLVKKYRKETSNVKALKGKIDFPGNIRLNLVHKERFHTTHQVYDTNHKIHQVLAEATDIVLQFTKGTRLSDLCRRVQLDFPDVDKINVNEQTFSSINLDRKTAPYEKALEVARLIILHYSPDIKSGREKMLSILFDMNILWEEYVLTMLKKECRGTKTKVKGQASKKFWGPYRTIRPDIVIEQEGGETIILDTKWKKPPNRSASIEDLRQMYTYGRFWNAEKVMLLYPGEPSETKFISYRNEEFDQTEHKCKLAFINVLNESKKLDTTIGEKILLQMKGN